MALLGQLALELCLLCAVSPILGSFCWRLIGLSVYVTFYAYASFRETLARSDSSFIAILSRLYILSALTLWCNLLSPLHDFKPSLELKDAWTPYSTRSNHQQVLFAYNPMRKASLDIIAIHGLGSDPYSAWTYGNSSTGVLWLRDLLPQKPDFEDVRIVMINHQTYWDSYSVSLMLDHQASELIKSIDTVHQEDPARPIIFMAHSYSGVLLKQALVQAKGRYGFAEMTRGIIFLGVPHTGTVAAFYAACLACTSFFRGASTELLEFVFPESPGPAKLESAFYDAYVNTPIVKPVIYDVWENRPGSMGKFDFGPTVGPIHMQPRHGNFKLMDTEHRGLIKYHSSDDPNFLAMLEILRAIKQHAVQSVTDMSPPRPPYIEPEVAPGAESEAGLKAEPKTFLGLASLGMPFVFPKISSMEAAGFYGLQDLVATRMVRRKTTERGLVPRVIRFALFGAVVHAPASQVQMWFLNWVFGERDEVWAQLVRVILFNIWIVSYLNILFVSALVVTHSPDLEDDHWTWEVQNTVLRLLTLWSWIMAPIYLWIAYMDLPRALWEPWFHLVRFHLCLWANQRVKSGQWSRSVPEASEKDGKNREAVRPTREALRMDRLQTEDDEERNAIWPGGFLSALMTVISKITGYWMDMTPLPKSEPRVTKLVFPRR
ncbi:hypothetical protein TWF696_000309 [Orbilia brochopaga]|uniref:DUF676 domain-containing protein n=1 Tax=Orbilia brochopaga TaxID=3140254 RepID=A0AAV9VAX3_9PEZI